MSGCSMVVVDGYEKGTGARIGAPGYSCTGSTMKNGERRRPHEDGYGHIAGGVEYPHTIYKWSDGSYTQYGETVNADGSPVSATDKGEAWALPEEPEVHTIVKAGPKNYTRWTAEPVSGSWQEVDNPDNVFTWAQLFVKSDGAPITYVGVNAKEKVKTEIRDILRDAGTVGLPNTTARGLVAALDDKNLLSNEELTPQAKVGDKFRVGVDKFPDNVTGIRRVRDDGTFFGMREWTRATNGLFKLETYDEGFADPSANTSTRYGDGGKMKTHGSTYVVTKVKG